MAAEIATKPLRERSLATYPMRRMLVSRSSLEKPRPLDRWVRISSPSRTSTRCPRLRSSSARRLASVDLPAPDIPVNHRVKPLLMCGEPYSEDNRLLVEHSKLLNLGK